MISIKSKIGIFNFRVAAIIIHNNKVLLHRSEHENLWSLPGGRCEMMEFSKETIQRELLEEINETVNVKDLIWIVENKFIHNSVNNHELGLYYKTELRANSSIKNKNEFFGVEDTHKLIFKWFKLTEIKDKNIYPVFLKEKLNSLPNSIEHIRFGT